MGHCLLYGYYFTTLGAFHGCSVVGLKIGNKGTLPEYAIPNTYVFLRLFLGPYFGFLERT